MAKVILCGTPSVLAHEYEQKGGEGKVNFLSRGHEYWVSSLGQGFWRSRSGVQFLSCSEGYKVVDKGVENGREGIGMGGYCTLGLRLIW